MTIFLMISSAVVLYLTMVAVSAALFWRMWDLGIGDEGLQWVAGALWPAVWIFYGPVKLMALLYEYVVSYERKPKLPPARVIK